jgi:hypothetical protein
MKRALIALPLVALILGLLLFLLRRPEGLAILSRSSAGSKSHETQPGSPQVPARPSSFVSSDPVENTGALKFTITSKGRPVTDSKITVQRAGTNDFMVIATESDGTQLLRGLPPVEYSILVEHPDYKAHEAEVTLAAGQTIQMPVDLKTGARIFGIVRDKAGNPIPETRVFLLVNGEMPVTRSAVYTNDKGYYAINGVPPGKFGIRFRHKDFKPLDHPDLPFRAPDDEWEINKVLEIGARVSGRVVDEHGSPIEGAVVVVSNENSAGLQKSDKDGLFTVPGLNDGPARVMASREGYGKVEFNGIPTNGADIELRLPKGGKIAGRVVVDEAPRQVQVVLARYDAGLRKDVMYDCKFFPDPPNGTFTYPDIAPGTYSLEILIEGYVANERPQITVAPGQTVDGLVVTFRKKT